MRSSLQGHLRPADNGGSSLIKGFVQECLGPGRPPLRAKHKPPDSCSQHMDVFAARYAFRAVIDAPRPDLRSLVCCSSPRASD